MPINDYYCGDCDFFVEDVFSIKSKDFIECPECGREIKKVPSFANFVVKGYNAKNTYGLKGDDNGKNS